jgi:hypothetical protein
MTRASLLLASLVVLAAPSARAIDGFTFGLEYARGGWDAKSDELALQTGGIGALYGAALEGDGARNGLHLHFGWNVLGHALIEATLQTSFWKPLTGTERGGVGLAGGRLTWMPLQLAAQLSKEKVLLERFYDLGLEFGAGYSIGGSKILNGSSQLGMDGSYTAFGVIAEVWHPRAKWVSLTLGWRYFRPSWTRLYTNFDDNIGVDVSDYHPGWNTFAVGLAFHSSTPTIDPEPAAK